MVIKLNPEDLFKGAKDLHKGALKELEAGKIRAEFAGDARKLAGL